MLETPLVLMVTKVPIMSLVFIKMVESLRSFDLIYVMTQGGPGIATRVMPLDMYLRGFKSFAQHNEKRNKHATHP